jgi:hypothetical protein
MRRLLIVAGMIVISLVVASQAVAATPANGFITRGAGPDDSEKAPFRNTVSCYDPGLVSRGKRRLLRSKTFFDRTCGLTERRRSRTDRAVGYTTAQVLKTCWATGPVPLRP